MMDDDPRRDAEDAGLARGLLRRARTAALSTHLAQGTWAGHPYASLVQLATDPAGAPLMLLSDLAQHTRDIAADPRAALLVDDATQDPGTLDRPRLTVLGEVHRTDDRAARRRYLARHPAAEQYAGFADFRLYRVAVRAGHLVAGFGRVRWLRADDLAAPAGLASGVAAIEAEAIEHMNRDHADAVDLVARHLLDRAGGGWRVVGIDPEGCDLGRGGELARAVFDAPVGDDDGLRRAMAELTRRARGAARGG